MDAQLLCFGTKERPSFADKINVPGTSGVDASGERGYALNIADTEGSIYTLLATRSLEPSQH